MSSVQDAMSTKRPNELLRVKLIYGVIGSFILILELLTQFYIGRSPEPGLAYFPLSILLSSALAWFLGRDIWALRVRHFPLWMDIAMYILVLGGLGIAIFLSESGIYVWDAIYLNVFFIWLSAQVAAVAWATEKSKNVRVYLGMRRLIFIKEQNF